MAKINKLEHASEGRSGLIAMTRPLYTKPPKLTDPLQRQRLAETTAATEQVTNLQIIGKCITRAIAGMRK